MQEQDARLAQLAGAGVRIVDPRQVYIAPEVELARIRPEVVLHPGTRLLGAGTFVGRGCEIGSQGPATLRDSVLGESVVIESGYVEGSVLLSGCKIGFASHLRDACLLEENTSIAHAVGLKHTVLLSFVTLGSLINFCDVLMAGGSSRIDHSEVGSGFIHFNFTPWGKSGDKATASLVGDVCEGVFLKSPRIFLGGSGGMVGPRRIGYGAMAAAGQVLREDVPTRVLVLEKSRSFFVPVQPGRKDAPDPRRRRNLEYIGQLLALRAWYRQVRLASLGKESRFADLRLTYEAAVAALDRCIAERVSRLGAFLSERGEALPELDLQDRSTCPIPLPDPAEFSGDHVAWVHGLTDADVERGSSWLCEIAASIVQS